MFAVATVCFVYLRAVACTLVPTTCPAHVTFVRVLLHAHAVPTTYICRYWWRWRFFHPWVDGAGFRWEGQFATCRWFYAFPYLCSPFPSALPSQHHTDFVTPFWVALPFYGHMTAAYPAIVLKCMHKHSFCVIIIHFVPAAVPHPCRSRCIPIYPTFPHYAYGHTIVYMPGDTVYYSGICHSPFYQGERICSARYLTTMTLLMPDDGISKL